MVSLDPKTARIVLADPRRAAADPGIAALCNRHPVPCVREFADRVARRHAGRIVLERPREAHLVDPHLHSLSACIPPRDLGVLSLVRLRQNRHSQPIGKSSSRWILTHGCGPKVSRGWPVNHLNPIRRKQFPEESDEARFDAVQPTYCRNYKEGQSTLEGGCQGTVMPYLQWWIPRVPSTLGAIPQ